MSSYRYLAAAAVSAWMATGCATMSQARVQDITSLEQQLAAAPADDDVAARLGVAYYQAARYDDARRVLSPLIERGVDAGTPYLYFGLASEELEDWASARTAYERYLEVGDNANVREELQLRLSLVAHEQLKQESRLALQREDELSQQAPTPNSIAVFPFQIVGTDERLEPLRTALADMVITDLGLSNAVNSVERVRVQSLLDEMVLTQAGLTDEQTGARAGRLLRAETVVQGVMAANDGEVRLDAAVLDTEGRTLRGDVTQAGDLERIFDLEKQLVFGILDRLGVTITLAERSAIEENRTGNLLAFLAYGSGLEAMDRGDYGEAATLFQQAASLDPGFNAAQTRSGNARAMSNARNSGPQQIAQAGLGEAGVQADASGDALLDNTLNEVNPTPAAEMVQTGSTGESSTTNSQDRTTPQNESSGQSGSTQAAKAVIIIRIPPPGGEL